MPEILQYAFMQRALLAGIIIALLCPLIGIFIVLRRMSLIGDALSYVALSGVVAGILLKISPLIVTLIFSVTAALGIEKLRKRYEKYAELSISIIMSAGMAVAVILISLTKSINIDLFGYLFGNITTVLSQDLWLILLLGIVVMISVFLLYKELFYMSFDEEAAALAGIPTRAINVYFVILVAITITLSMRIVGILLISSLMILPVAASLQIAKSFKSVTILSIVFAQISVILGIIISYYFELASGGTIVLISVVILLTVLAVKNIINIRKINFK